MATSTFITVAQVASEAAKTTARVYQWLASGELPHEKRYGRIVVSRKAFKQFMRLRGEIPTSDPIAEQADADDARILSAEMRAEYDKDPFTRGEARNEIEADR